MSVKKQRHAKILEIIENNVIERQEEIARLLGDAGFNVTQATVSRDIHDLRLVKTTRDDGIQTYTASGTAATDRFTAQLHEIFSRSVISVTPAANIVVVKTLSGTAQAAAAAVDSIGIEEIAGCIAGDDTIMIVTASTENATAVCSRLNHMRT